MKKYSEPELKVFAFDIEDITNGQDNPVSGADFDRLIGGFDEEYSDSYFGD